MDMRRSKRTQVLTRAVLGFGLASGGLATFAAQARANLNIVPTFDSTITGDSNASIIEASINSAISNVEGYIADPVTVNITFAEMSGGLGRSLTYVSPQSYSSYLSALQNNQTLSADDNSALATLPAGPNDPVIGGTTVTATLPVFRALGFNINPPPGQPDSTVSFNESIINNSRPDSDPNKYDLQSVVTHEMDEVLGIGGPGSQLNNGGSSVGPLDLFRYSAGARSFATSANVSSYFSIDGGTTDFVHFNQLSLGDFGDWGNGVTPAQQQGNSPPQVQDAFGAPAATPNDGPNELAALNVVGWNLTAAGLAAEAVLISNLTWVDASGNNVWDNGTSSNWNNGSSITTFSAPSNVTFNDSNGAAAGRYSVTLNTTVSPGSITVNNSSGNYTISGTGTIAGTGSLTKFGSGTLTFSTANTYQRRDERHRRPAPDRADQCHDQRFAEGRVAISGSGTVQLATNVTLGSQSANVPTTAPTSNVNITSLSITGSGTFDIGNNHIIINYGSGPDPIASIAAWIADGAYGGGDIPGPEPASPPAPPRTIPAMASVTPTRPILAIPPAWLPARSKSCTPFSATPTWTAKSTAPTST